MELPKLPVRPRAITFTVGDILTMARRGELRVPGFQTGLRWRSEHVTELFDSIVRGFPIGGFLLWKKGADAARLKFGPVTVDAAARGDALYVVDGQQRITALIGALLHPDERPRGDNYALWVDLKTGRFHVLRDQPGPTWIPVNTLGERTRLQQWARTVDFDTLTDDLVERAFAIEEAIIRYGVSAYVVEDASESALRLIFSRTNSAGVPLGEDQVFQALFGATASAKPLEEAAAWLDEQTGFGHLPARWLLRCIKAVGELSPRLRFTEQRPPSPDLIHETREALRRAIVFLQTHCDVIHTSVLPYRFPLIVLARFFHLHPDPHPRNLTLLSRWLWRGALSGQHSASNQAVVGAHLADLGTDEAASVQNLIRRLPTKGFTLPGATQTWYGRAAATRIHAISMLCQHPLHPESEEEWEPTDVQQALTTSLLSDLFRSPFGGSRSMIAAVALLPRGYRASNLRHASEEVLASLAIDAEAAVALRVGDELAFIEARARTLTERLDRLIRLRAAPGETDRPPLSVLRTGT